MYNFGERPTEKNKQGQVVEVIVSKKYEESKKKAIATIDKYEEIHEGDFWILKNETKDGRILYTGLIMSHNACLKINETLDKKDRFRPECVTVDKDGYAQSLAFTYCCPEQGIYEVGEASKANCKNAYPYAMAFKRCFDRVVLKMSKLAFDGIYSESEAEDFSYAKNATESNSVPQEVPQDMNDKVTDGQVQALAKMIEDTDSDLDMFLSYYGVPTLEDMTKKQYGLALNTLARKKEKKGTIGVEQ